MRFIRKNGRVVPIRDNSAKLNRGTEILKSAAGGAVANAVAFGGRNYAAAMGLKKTAAKLPLIGLGIGIGSMGRNIAVSQKLAKQNHTDAPSEFAGLYLGALGGGIGGSLLSHMALKPAVKVTIMGKEAARRGAQALHKAVKPHTSAFADYRRFKKAKFVQPIPLERKLLK